MSAGEQVTLVTNSDQKAVPGRIQCAPGYAVNPDLYITVVNQYELFSKTAQPADQHFIMVKTASLGDSFLLATYPVPDRVMMATLIKSEVGGTKVLLEPVGKPGEYLVNGGKLPRDFGKQYQFRLDKISTNKFYIYSNSDYDGPQTLIQTGYGSTGGKVNQPIILDEYSGNQWEPFSFENPPY